MYEDKITYSAADVMQMVEDRLDELKPFQYDSRCRLLLGDTFVRKLNSWEREIRSRKNDPFTLVVCGEFKRGKSSLINAILQEDVVSTNVTTETVTLNRISYGPHGNEAVLSGGRRLKLTDEQLCREQLEQLMAELHEPIQELELSRPIELLKQVTIVDTPGMGDAMRDFSSMVDHAMQQADAVIYVFSVNYPLSQTEQLFLKTAVLPQKYTDLFLVANYCDTMPTEQDLRRMQQLLETKISGLLPDMHPVMLSALDERCRQLGEERPNAEMQELLEQNFRTFRAQLEHNVAQKQSMVLPDRMQRVLQAMAEDLSQMLTAAEEGLQMSAEDVQAAMERLNEQCREQECKQQEIRESISTEITNMEVQSKEWMLEILDRLQQEVGTLSGVERSELVKYYSFYCIDTVHEAMSRCVEFHTEMLYDMLDEISAEITRSLTKTADVGKYNFRFNLDNQTWTKGDNISYVASKLNFGLLSVIADGITGTMRQKEMQKNTPEVLNQIQKQYQPMRASVNEALHNAYEQRKKNITEQLDDYYTQKLDLAREKVEQSAVTARQNKEKKEEISAVIEAIRDVLKRLADF